MAWLRDQRRAEPVSPASILVVVVLLGVLVLGIGGGLPRILGSDEDRQPVGLLTPADPLPLPTASGDSPASAPSEPATANVTTPPVQTNGPPPGAFATSNEVVGAWARTFYTRDPSAQSYEQLVDTASRYMTPEMASSFETQGDSTYDALRADGGKSTVVSAVVSAPKEGTAPTDTPERVSRFVNVVIDITGKNPQRITVPLLVTVVLQGTTWLISDVDGGEGI